MALFRKKTAENNDGEESAAAFTPQPEKARKWFEHAKTAAMSSNYDYALSCYANGIKLDPGSLPVHEAMFEAAVRYMNGGGKSASGRTVRGLDDGSAVGKLAAAEFEWMKDLKSPKAALKALEATVKAEQLEIGHWMAPRVFNLVRGQKKLTKSSLIQLMELLRSVGAWDQSMAAGELARQLDPHDNDLDAELKNLAAQRAMDQGGYADAAGQEGDFRRFIKDADQQQALLEEESLSAGGSTDARNLARARAAYEATPDAPDVLNRYAQLVKKQGTPEASEQALAIYEKGFGDTGEYRFRMNAGDIRIEILTDRVRTLEEQLGNSDGDEALASQLESARRELLELRRAEYTARVEKYPTDRNRKYDLGTVLYDLGEQGEAMAYFQAAKDEPKLRVRAGHMLGRCFLADGWHAEAISELEDALQAVDATERDRALAIRYDLMLALLAAADEEQSVDLAKQAKDICSEIARKDITYRDIRLKRKEVDELIKRVTSGS